jgi:hypothetical protein
VPSSASQWSLTATVLAAALVKGMALLLLIPPFQGADEYAHYDYALYLSKIDLTRYLTGRSGREATLTLHLTTHEARFLTEATGTADHAQTGAPFRARWGLGEMSRRSAAFRDEDTPGSLEGRRELGQAFIYPPLYYLGAALVLRGAAVCDLDILTRFYLVRLYSLLLFITALAVAAKALQLITGDAIVRNVALFAIAFQPQLSAVSVAVQPDNLSVLLVTTNVLLFVRYLRDRQALDACLFGVVSGLHLLSKPHFFPIVHGAALVTMACMWHGADAGTRRGLVKAAMVSTLLALVVGAWWSVRAFVLYDNLIGLPRTYRQPFSAAFVSNLVTWIAVWTRQMYESYWGIWGWLEYGLPAWVYELLRVWSVAPLVVYGVAWHWKTAQGEPFHCWRIWLFFATTMVLLALAMAIIAGSVGIGVNTQGRNWLPLVLVQAWYLSAYLELFQAVWITRVRAMQRAPRRLVTLWLATAALALVCAGIARAPLPADGHLRLCLDLDRDALVRVEYEAVTGDARRAVSDARVSAASGCHDFPLRGRRIERVWISIPEGPARARVTSAQMVDSTGGNLQRVERIDTLDGVDQVELPLSEPVVLPRGMTTELRVAASLLAPPLVPWLAAAALAGPLVWFVWRRMPTEPTRLDRIRMRVAWGYVGTFAALNAHLAVKTWQHYW